MNSLPPHLPLLGNDIPTYQRHVPPNHFDVNPTPLQANSANNRTSISTSYSHKLQGRRAARIRPYDLPSETKQCNAYINRQLKYLRRYLERFHRISRIEFHLQIFRPGCWDRVKLQSVSISSPLLTDVMADLQDTIEEKYGQAYLTQNDNSENTGYVIDLPPHDWNTESKIASYVHSSIQDRTKTDKFVGSLAAELIKRMLGGPPNYHVGVKPSAWPRHIEFKSPSKITPIAKRWQLILYALSMIPRSAAEQSFRNAKFAILKQSPNVIETRVFNKALTLVEQNTESLRGLHNKSNISLKPRKFLIILDSASKNASVQDINSNRDTNVEENQNDVNLALVIRNGNDVNNNDGDSDDDISDDDLSIFDESSAMMEASEDEEDSDERPRPAMLRSNSDLPLTPPTSQLPPETIMFQQSHNLNHLSRPAQTGNTHSWSSRSISAESRANSLLTCAAWLPQNPTTTATTVSDHNSRRMPPVYSTHINDDRRLFECRTRQAIAQNRHFHPPNITDLNHSAHTLTSFLPNNHPRLMPNNCTLPSVGSYNAARQNATPQN